MSAKASVPAPRAVAPAQVSAKASAPARPRAVATTRPTKRTVAAVKTPAKREQLVKPSRTEQVTLFAQKMDAISRIESLKQRLLSQAGANRVNEAIATQTVLREALPENDVFLVKDAPLAIASAYVRLAAEAARNGRIEDALNFANTGSHLVPELQEAAVARNRYLEYWEIDDLLRNGERVLTPHVRYRVWRVSKLAPDEMPAVKQRLARDLTNRIQATRDPKLAAHLSRVGQAVFGSDTSVEALVEQVAAGAGSSR
jgi:hypothetical protein